MQKFKEKARRLPKHYSNDPVYQYEEYTEEKFYEDQEDIAFRKADEAIKSEQENRE